MATGTGSSTVQLVINVVDANSGEVISRVTKNIDALGISAATSGRKVAGGFNEVALAGQRAGKDVADGFEEMGRHSLSALDNVRLLRDDLGIRIPRAMESVIAKSGALSGAIAAAGSGFVALGAVELLAHVGEQVYQIYERWLDTTKAVKDYEMEAGKAARQKLFDSPSFDTQMRLLQQAQSEVANLTAKKKASESQSIVLWGYDKLTGKGYQSAYDDLNSLSLEAKQRTKQMGSGAESYYSDTIKPRLDEYMQRLTREQKAGRSQVGMTGGQFDVGGPITGFGSMASRPSR